MSQSELQQKIYNYPTKYPQGFTHEEVKLILLEYPNINMDKYHEALMGNTCMIINDNFITYHRDLYNALKCGLENRSLTINEWD